MKRFHKYNFFFVTLLNHIIFAKTVISIHAKTLIFLLLMLALIPVEAQNISSGLYFAAHTSIKEERTSLILSPEFDASKGLTLDFDIKFRPEEHNYGYVFRIIIDDEKSFDLIANITPEKER